MIKLSLTFKGKLIKVYQPHSKQLKIGRANNCDIIIDNLAVANLHALIEIDGNKAIIFDKSGGINANPIGVEVNGKKVEKHELNHNDEIQLGKYSLVFTREIDTEIPQAETAFPKQEKPKQGWLQFLSGPKLGRTIKLDNPMIRLGKSGKTSAMISTRNGKYFVSHLEGEPRTRVADQAVPESPTILNDGDTLQVGETLMLFFLQ